MSNNLIDANGQRIPWPSEQQLQTDESKLAGLHKHFAEHPSSGLTPSRLGTIMRAAEEGDLTAQCDLAEDLEEKDGHIASELQKRKLALLNLTGTVEPCRTASASEKKDAAIVQELFDEISDQSELILDMADAILKGFSNIELEWKHWGTDWVIQQTHYRPQNWFQLHPDNRNEIRLRDNSPEGIALQPFGWVQHIHRSRSGYVGRNGLTRVLAWPFLFKNYSVRDLAEFLEIYGLPIRLGKYPAGASDSEKSMLLKAVMSIGHNAGGIIPKGMEIEFQNAAEGASSPYEAMISWCERTQSKAILGGTLTSQADGKSSTNALGNVHNEVRQDLRESDLRQIAATITRDIVRPLWMLNGRAAGDPRRQPVFVFDTAEPEDIAVYSQHLPSLVTLGMQIPQAWAHEKLQIPQPEGDEPVLGMPPEKPNGDKKSAKDTPEESEPEETKAQLAALKANQDKALAGFPDQQAIEAALEQLEAGDLNEQMLGILQPILAAAGDDPHQIRAQLASLWSDMDDQLLTERVAKLLFIGELWGFAHG